jgi:hypothetical protein
MAPVTKARAKAPAQHVPVGESPQVPLRFHDVMLALSKAKAALVLLQEMDDTSIPSALNIEQDYGLKPDDAEGWIRTIAIEASVGAIREAEAAFLKSQADKQAAT